MEHLTVLLKVFVLICVIQFVSSECVLRFPKSRKNIPKYRKYVGTRTKTVPYNAGFIHLKNGELISGYCASEFNDQFYQNEPNYYVKLNRGLEASIWCKNGVLRYFDGRTEPSENLSCFDLEWNWYESISGFPWCEKNMGSYILATKTLSNVTVLAAICYDIYKMSLDSLHYLAAPKSLTADHNNLKIELPHNLNNLQLGTEIENFNSFFEKHSSEVSVRSELISNNKFNYWLHFANYEYEPIVQGGAYIEYFNEYDSLLTIPWWHNLRHGNWKRFMDTLDARTETMRYNIFTGTSGAVTAPLVNNKCLQSDFVELKLDLTNKTIPAYVWTYLQATDGSEEFVFVGYNSPYFDFFNETDIIFCEDICAEITWLNEIRSTFRYSLLGVSFCCSAEAVRKSNFLQGFPIDFSPATNSEDNTIADLLLNDNSTSSEVEYH